MSGVSKCRRASCSRRCPDGDWMYCMIRRINRFIANTSFSGLVSIVTTARYGASSYSTRERAACGDPAWGLSTGRGRVYGIGAMNCVPTVRDSADVSRRKVWLWHLVETIVFSNRASTMPPLLRRQHCRRCGSGCGPVSGAQLAHWGSPWCAWVGPRRWEVCALRAVSGWLRWG